MIRPPRPSPADLIREARRCEGEAAYWESLATQDSLTVPLLVHAHGRACHWAEQARRWESAARAACGPLRWAWWCRRHTVPVEFSGRNRHGVAVLWPEKAPVSPERRY